MTSKATFSSKLPSVGFCALVLIHVALVLFLAWGFQKPALERVWELHHALKIGEIGKLKSKDHSLLSKALERHAELAEALVSEGSIGVISAHTYGWLETPEATIIRSKAAGDACDIKFDVSIPDEALPVSVKLAGFGWTQDLSIKKQGSTSFRLPKPTRAPEIIDLEVAASGGHDEVATLGVSVDFACEGDAQRKKTKRKAEVDD